MKFRTLIPSIILGITALTSLCSCANAATDFNDVGQKIALLLQNAHYERTTKTFNSKLSENIFDTYITSLDPAKLFFTQEDIDKLSKKYRNELDGYFLAKDAMIPAREIYKLFSKRAEERIKYAKTLIDNNNFTYDSNKSIDRLRKKADWPKNEAEAKQLWKDRIEEQMLSEILRKETIASIAKKQGKSDPSASEKAPSERLKLRYDRILHSLQEADEEDMAKYFFSALARTYDPHTDYMSTREMDRFKDSMKGELIGIGALLGAEDDGSTKVSGIVVGGPADKSNKIKLNDKILAVDSNNDGEMTDILYMKIDKVVDLIRGKEGTTIRLKIESPESPGEAKIINLVRSKVELKDELAKGEIIEEKDHNGAPRKIGIISLPAFYFDMEGGKRRSSTDVRLLLERMNKEKVDGLVFDLRGNGGGGLEEVRKMSGFFLGHAPVVQIKDTKNYIEVKSSDKSPTPTEPIFTQPMVVLTNKLSASASEILAAVLQDHGRAVVIGDTSTFGKGTVQQPIDMERYLAFFADASRAGALKLTTQKFYRIAGGSTQHKGVVSDIVIPSSTAAFDLGESTMDYALPYDEIRPVKGYIKDPKLIALLPELKKRSAARVAKDPDFLLLKKEIARTKQRIDENKLSLNKKVRKQEIDEQEQWRIQTNEERKKRYPLIEDNDKKRYNFYRMNLDDLKLATLPPADWSKDKDSTMKLAKDDTEELDDSPDIPSGLDWGMREAINVVNDIIDLSASTGTQN